MPSTPTTTPSRPTPPWRSADGLRHLLEPARDPLPRHDPRRVAAGRIHDPLWLLARQWQVGEFTGDDGGSPVQARARIDNRALGWYAANGGTAAAYDPVAEPLEARVEREAAPEGDLRLAIAGGRRLLGFLQAQGGSTATRVALLGAFAVLPAVASDDPPDLTRERLASAMAGRAIDGERVYAAIRLTLAPDGTGALPNGLPADPALLPACVEFLGWWESHTGSTADPAWTDPRMEYDFAVATATGDELVLTARGHPGGTLDWPSFDAADGATIRPAAGAAATKVVRTVIPAPVSFKGMPAARFWEIEDGSVDLGAIDAASDDLARLLVMEFALVYGNDFFVVPVRLPVGSVSTVASLVVTDSFGVRTLIDTAEVADGGSRQLEHVPALGRPPRPGEPRRGAGRVPAYARARPASRGRCGR